MHYNFVADSFHRKKLCSRLSYSKFVILLVKWPFTFLSLQCGLGATYDVHLRLTRKCIVDFLLVLIELILLEATVEALRASID